MVHKHSYWQMALSIIFIVAMLFFVTWAITAYSDKYNTSFNKTNEAIEKSLEQTNVSDQGISKKYKGMQQEANAVNQMLMLLFFMALILFFIFWLVIMLRRSIIH